MLQSKERYKTADELVDISKHRDRDVPVDVIIQDWQYWGGMDQWSGMRVDQDKFGDLAAAGDQLHHGHPSDDFYLAVNRRGE